MLAQLKTVVLIKEALKLAFIRLVEYLDHQYLWVRLQAQNCQKQITLVLWSKFSSKISLYFASFIFASILTSFPVPAPEKIPATMRHCRHGARIPPDVMIGIQAKKLNLGFIRPENLVSHGLRLL